MLLNNYMAYRTLITFVAAAVLAFSLALVRAGDSDSPVTLKSKDGLTQLVLPAGWVNQQSSNPSAAVEGRNDDSNAFVMVIVTDRTDPYLTLDEYAKSLRDEVLSHLVNSKFTGPESLQVCGYKALQYELHGTSPASKIDFGYFLTVVQMRRHYLQIVGWSVERHFAENSAVLKGAAKNVTYSGDK
jgi:hypothetical protein